MNQRLLELYTSKWEGLSSAMQSILKNDSLASKPTCPLLLSVNDEEAFKKADIRLMIYGQETNNWYKTFHNDMHEIRGNYDSFFNAGECWSYGGQFWNGIKRFLELLQQKHPNKRISLLWNNLVKIGKLDEKGFPPEYIYQAERETFSVLEEEIKILQPTLILFLTGPNYDGIIASNFNNPDYHAISTEFSGRQISQISLTNVPFVFRTYHPNYLWRHNINSYFQTIIDATGFINSAA